MNSVCVIVAARGAAPWIGQCISSIWGQALPASWRLRILLGVDQCPLTLEYAQRISCEALQVFMFPTRVGPYVVFNSLAHIAHDDLIARFDADDVMLPGYLAAQIARFPSLSTPAISQTWSIYTDDGLRPVQATLASGATTHKDGRRDGPADGQFVMSQGVIGLLGGFQSWLCHADTEFLVRARLLRIPFVVCPEHLYLRRMHGGSLTNSRASDYHSRLRREYAASVDQTKARFATHRIIERVAPLRVPCYRIAPSGAGRRYEQGRGAAQC